MIPYCMLHHGQVGLCHHTCTVMGANKWYGILIPWAVLYVSFKVVHCCSFYYWPTHPWLLLVNNVYLVFWMDTTYISLALFSVTWIIGLVIRVSKGWDWAGVCPCPTFKARVRLGPEEKSIPSSFLNCFYNTMNIICCWKFLHCKRSWGLRDLVRTGSK